jgi:hypothetical protein
MRDSSTTPSTSELDKLLAGIGDKEYAAVSIAEIQTLLEQIQLDESESEHVWDANAIAASVRQYADLHKKKECYVYVDRNRDLQERRRETQGILSGGEVRTVPDDCLTLFLLRTKSKGKQQAAWWPQIRFPTGRYAFAFSI